VILVGGMSAGCMLALRLAETRPDRVHGLMMFAPTFWPNGWAIPKSFHIFRLFYHKFFLQFFHFQQRPPYGIKDERIRNFVIDSFRSEDRPIEDLFGRGGGLVWEFKSLAREVRRGLGNISQRMLVFHPREDDQSDMSNSVILARETKSLVEMVILDDSYHMVTLDRQRSFVVDRTLDFAQRLTQSIQDRQSVSRRAKGVGE
jgi:carboxylesterase